MRFNSRVFLRAFWLISFIFYVFSAQLRSTFHCCKSSQSSTSESELMRNSSEDCWLQFFLCFKHVKFYKRPCMLYTGTPPFPIKLLSFLVFFFGVQQVFFSILIRKKSKKCFDLLAKSHKTLVCQYLKKARAKTLLSFFPLQKHSIPPFLKACIKKRTLSIIEITKISVRFEL